jgi:hypothetical protein
MNHHQARIIFIILLFTGITACSFKTLYNNLDFLIPQYVEDMVSLDDVLEEKFKIRTLVLLSWHRNTQLKQYADWMRSVQQDAGPQLSVLKVKQRLNEMEQFWLAISVQVNDEMAELLPLLSKQQLQELYGSIANANEEFREKYVTIAEQDRRENYYDNLTEVYENWFGTLSQAQEKALEKASLALRSTADLRLKRRLDWQNGIREILDSDASEAQKNASLRTFLAGFEEFANKAMKKNSDLNRDIIARLTVQIVHSMDKEQKQFFISKTDEYIRIFTELAENR